MDAYGYCLLPKNTLLFRGSSETSFVDCMSFTTKHFVAGAFNENIQVWKTTKDIELLFLVEYLTDRSYAISAVLPLYKTLFPSESELNLDDLDIKRDLSRRDKLVRTLYGSYKVSGWFSSLESKIEVEVCLFGKAENSKQLVFVENTDRNNDNYHRDSLEKINVYPSADFYTRTKNT